MSKNSFNFKNFGTKSKITVILLIPAVILITFGILNNSYHMSVHKNLIISNYSNELNSFLKDTEDKMNLVLSSAPFIASNTEITKVLSATQTPDSQTASAVVYSLKQATNFLDIIDGIAVYNKTAGFVISPTGMYNSNVYFDSICPYTQYSPSYWSNYRSSNNIQILTPTVINSSTSSYSKTIVPLIFNNSVNSIVIFNININTLFEQFELYRLTPNSKIYMMDNTNGNMYSNSSLLENNTLEYTFLQSLKNSLQSHTDIVSVNHKKYLLIKSTHRANSWGYTYLVTVPYSDISKQVTTILFMSILLVLILFAVLIIFVSFGSIQLYNPWKKAASSLNSDENKHPKDIEDFVAKSIAELSHSNKELEKNLEIVLPLSQEKYLINVLNNDINTDNSDNQLISLNFKYEYFAAITVNITINSDFFINEDISIAFMQKQVQNAIKSFFTSEFITYELPGAKNIMYLLLNLNNDSCYQQINMLIKKIQVFLENDKENMNVVFSTGKIYKGLDGLKLTHQESLSNMIQHLNSSKIQFSAPKTINIFSINSENIFTNYLMIGLIDKAKEFLRDIFKNLYNESISNKKQAYIDIANCIKKVLVQKNIQSTISSIEYIFDIINKNVEISDQKIQENFFNILDIIEEHMQINSKKFNIEEVIDYINNHYSENIFLDELAEKYHISAKHLSKKIKQYLNVSFKDYTTQLKINKAKELLATSDITITKLFSMVGFQDRISFTRAFKQKTGISPSEYKKNIHSKS